MGETVTIIGAGIVGLACAAELGKRGHKVVLVDRCAPGEGASGGNAGALALGLVLPLASPEIMRKAPRWLLDPLGPLSLRLGYGVGALPWFWRFWRASRKEQFRQSATALAALNSLSHTATTRLFGEAGLAQDLDPLPALYLYEKEAAFRRSLPEWRLKAELGVEFEELDSGAIRELEPNLAPIFPFAMRLPNWFLVSDPLKICHRLASYVSDCGVEIIRGEVIDRDTSGPAIALKLKEGRSIESDRLVVAAGAWSHHIARQFGDIFPLESERGYNSTIADPGIKVAHQFCFEEHGFVTSPLECGFRIGGAVEFAGLEAPPRFARSRALVKKAKRFLPDLQTEGCVEWMGHRPSLPDSLPVIDRSGQDPRVAYAFGHGHLGLTQAAITAQLLADVMEGAESPIDRQPFRANRF